MAFGEKGPTLACVAVAEGYNTIRDKGMEPQRSLPTDAKTPLAKPRTWAQHALSGPLCMPEPNAVWTHRPKPEDLSSWVL